MLLILSERPLSDWASSQIIKNALGAGLNKNDLEFCQNKDFNPLKNYNLVMPCDDSSLRLVSNQYSVAETNCYLLQETSKVRCPVIPFYHPNLCMRDLSRFLFLKIAFQNAKKYLDEDFDVVPKLLISNNPVEIDTYLKKCEASKEVCIDLETTYDVSKVSPLSGNWKDVITAIGISTNEDEAMCFSRENLTPLQFNSFINRVVKINANPNIDKVGQNYVMFDAQVLYWWKASQGLRDSKTNLIRPVAEFLPKGNLWDTMHLFNILYPNDKSGRSIKGLSKGLAEQIRLYTLSDYHKDGSFSKRGVELRRYCALDVIQTYRIRNKQLNEMAERGMEGYYEKYRLPLGEVIVQRQIEGIQVDTNLLGLLKKEAAQEVTRLKAEINNLFGKYLPPKATEGGRDYMGDQIVYIDPDWNFPTDLTKLSRKALDKLLLDKGIVPVKSQAALYFVAKKQHLKQNPNYQIGSLYKKARTITLQKRPLNPSSAIQLREVFKTMKVRLPRNSTDATAIATLLLKKDLPAEARELCLLLEKYSKVEKFKSTYCGVKLDLDNRLRGSFNIEANDTGRSACRRTMWGTGFNLQTLPSYIMEISVNG